MKETLKERNDEMEIDLQELLVAYLKKWWLIVLCGVVVAAGALVYTVALVTPMYQSSISVYVNNMRGTQGTEDLSKSNLDASRQLVNTYVTIAKSDRVLQKVAETLGGDYTVKDLQEMFSAAQVGDTEIFELSVDSPDPEEAARVANTMAAVVPEEIASVIEGSSARVIDYAKVPEDPYTPSYKKNILMGALIGCFLALAYLTVAYLLDVRIKDGEDLNKNFDLPVLGQIPDFHLVGSKKRRGYGYGYGYDYGNRPTSRQKGEDQ